MFRVSASSIIAAATSLTDNAMLVLVKYRVVHPCSVNAFFIPDDYSC